MQVPIAKCLSHAEVKIFQLIGLYKLLFCKFNNSSNKKDTNTNFHHLLLPCLQLKKKAAILLSNFTYVTKQKELKSMLVTIGKVKAYRP